MITLDNMSEEQKMKRERFYSFYIPELIKMLGEMFDKDIENVKNQEFYPYYENIINKSAKLLKEIGATDPLTASAAIQYLLWNGYFSKDKGLKYGEDKRVNNFGACGADVVLGRSVCLNNADFEASVLRALGKEAYIIGARLNPKDDFDFAYKPKIERSMAKDVSLGHKLLVKLIELTPLRKVGNHAVTLVRIEGQYIISDPTNLAYANIDDFMKATYVGSTGSFVLKPWLMLLLEGLSEKKFKEIIEDTLAHSDNSLLDTRMVKQVYENGIYLCQRNRYLLDEFCEDIRIDVDTVARTMVKVKRK